MTRAGGVSTITQRKPETRGAKNRKSEPDARREAGLAADPVATRGQRRSGMVRRPDASKRFSHGRPPKASPLQRAGLRAPRRQVKPRTERRGQRTPKGRERQTSREVADRPVRRERGGRQTDRPGRRWWSRKPTPRVLTLRHRLAHFSEQVFNRIGRDSKESPSGPGR